MPGPRKRLTLGSLAAATNKRNQSMNPPDAPPPFTIREPMGNLVRIVGIHPRTLKWMADTCQNYDPDTAYIETELTEEEYKACIERGLPLVKNQPFQPLQP